MSAAARAKTSAEKHKMPAKRETFTAAKRQRFLDAIRDGKNRQQAAALVGLTGSRVRKVSREGSAAYDPVFADLYAEALEDGNAHTAEILAEEGLRRQLGSDPASKSDRGLHNERIFRDPDYRAAHRQAPSVSVTTEMEVTHVHIALEQLRGQLAEVVDLDAARATVSRAASAGRTLTG